MSPAYAFATFTLIGESFAGDGPNAAHLNIVIGRKGSPVETAWTTALATPRTGYIPFLTVLRPNLPVKPMTLFVNKADLRGETHERLTWGAAHAGVAAGIARAVDEGLIPGDEVDYLLVIAAVWVDWAADDEDLVYANNLAATHDAVAAAAQSKPTLEDVAAAMGEPSNAYYRRHRA